MGKICCLLLLLLSLPVSANEPTFSLFLTAEEQEKYNEQINHDLLPWPSNKLMLKAIMIMDKGRWTIWINEHKITTEACPEHLKVLAVKPDGVDLIWTTEKGPQQVHLKVNGSIAVKDME
jgi:hypothetical protein